MADDSIEQLKIVSKKFEYFSLALDESTDISDTSQLLIFVRGLNADFEKNRRIGRNAFDDEYHTRSGNFSRNNQRA